MTDGEGPGGGRGAGILGRGALIGAGGATVLIVLVLIASAHRPPLLHSAAHDRVGRHTGPPPSGLFPTLRMPPGAHRSSGRAAAQTPALFGQIVAGIVLVLVTLLLLWVGAGVVVAVRRRLLAQRAAAAQEPLGQVPDAVVDAVARVVLRQQGELAHSAVPRNAIVACWVDVEETIAAAGLPRRPSETSSELSIRVLDQIDVDRAGLRTLSELYRAARYSDHPIDESDRAAAQEALAALDRSLAARRPVART